MPIVDSTQTTYRLRRCRCPARRSPTRSLVRRRRGCWRNTFAPCRGVRHVAWSFGLPPGGGALSFGEWHSDMPGGPALNMDVEHSKVGSEFFALYRIPLLRGRTFEPTDSPRDVIVGERFAHALWPGVDPIGRRFRFQQEWFHVIGLAREVHHPSLDPRVDRPEFYELMDGVHSYAMLSVRCESACPNVAVLRSTLAAANPAGTRQRGSRTGRCVFRGARAPARLGSTGIYLCGNRRSHGRWRPVQCAELCGQPPAPGVRGSNSTRRVAEADTPAGSWGWLESCAGRRCRRWGCGVDARPGARIAAIRRHHVGSWQLGPRDYPPRRHHGRRFMAPCQIGRPNGPDPLTQGGMKSHL